MFTKLGVFVTDFDRFVYTRNEPVPREAATVDATYGRSRWVCDAFGGGHDDSAYGDGGLGAVSSRGDGIHLRHTATTVAAVRHHPRT